MAGGASGFAGDSQLDLAMGYVLGVRQWSRSGNGRLQGVHSFSWQDGENVAACRQKHRPPHSASARELQAATRQRDALFATIQRVQTKHPKGISDLPPAERKSYEAVYAEWEEVEARISSGALTDCGCGFWAYWALNPAEFRMGEKPIVGVIKGYGKVLLGTRGFRSEKAKIVGLHLAYEYVKPKLAKPSPPETSPSAPGWASMFAADYETNSAEGVAKMAADEAELGELYPGARIFATLPALLEAFPPTREYASG